MKSIGVIEYVKENLGLEQRCYSLCYNSMLRHSESPTYPRHNLTEGIRLDLGKKIQEELKIDPTV